MANDFFEKVDTNDFCSTFIFCKGLSQSLGINCLNVNFSKKKETKYYNPKNI